MIKHNLEIHVSTWINVKNYFEKKTPIARGFHCCDTVNGSKHAVEHASCTIYEFLQIW